MQRSAECTRFDHFAIRRYSDGLLPETVQLNAFEWDQFVCNHEKGSTILLDDIRKDPHFGHDQIFSRNLFIYFRI